MERVYPKIYLPHRVQETVNAAAEYTYNPNTTLSVSPAKAEYDKQKGERNTLGAIAIAYCFIRTLNKKEERGPFGTIVAKTFDTTREIRTEYPDFTVLRTEELMADIFGTCAEDMLDETKEMSRAPVNSFKRKVYDRLTRLTEGHFYHQVPKDKRRFKPATEFISRGFQTAHEVMGAYMNNLTIVFAEKNGRLPSPQELSRVAKRSYQPINVLAGHHIDDAEAILKMIQFGSNGLDHALKSQTEDWFSYFPPQIFETLFLPSGDFLLC